MAKVYHYYACAARKKERRLSQRQMKRRASLSGMPSSRPLEYVLSPKRVDLIARAVVKQYDKEFSNRAVADLERSTRVEADLNKLVDSLLDAPKAAHARIYARMEALEAREGGDGARPGETAD